MKKSVGIIGFGAFGQFMAKYLEPHFSVIFFDPIVTGSSSLAEVCKVDFLILAVPVQHLESLLIEISPMIKVNTLVIDVCSIKVEPMNLMQKYLPKEISFVGTHPLFGPKSGANGIKDLRIAVCNGNISLEQLEKLKKFLSEKLELQVIETTPLEHDKQMAYVQGLTHFIAKGLSKIELPENLELQTATFEHLIKLKDIVGMDSEELFKVIQNLNPYTKVVRETLLKELGEIDRKLADS